MIFTYTAVSEMKLFISLLIQVYRKSNLLHIKVWMRTFTLQINLKHLFCFNTL